MEPPNAPAVLQRLVAATNTHDLDALVACFSPDYVNETPVHPDRNFRGREQVRANWAQIFAAVPDVETTVHDWALNGESLWVEMEQRGTRPDGQPLALRGVNIFGIGDDRIRSIRLYMEPVQHDGTDIDAAVQSHVGARSAAS
jgi:ketosteroid isomerase-like protein